MGVSRKHGCLPKQPSTKGRSGSQIYIYISTVDLLGAFRPLALLTSAEVVSCAAADVVCLGAKSGRPIIEASTIAAIGTT